MEGFDGRGGAIYSEGSVWFKGGVISGNTPKVIEKVIFVTEVSVELFMWQKAVRYMFRAVH